MSLAPVPLAILTVAAIACVTDVRTRRIPNALTFSAAAAAIVFHLFAGGVSGAAWALLGWTAGLALFLPFFLLRGMGAGDVKLLAALGAWVGPAHVLWLALFTSIAGGVMALAIAASTGYLRAMFDNLRSMLLFWYIAGPRPVPEQTLEKSQSPRLAYAVPIFVGTVVLIWHQ